MIPVKIDATDYDYPDFQPDQLLTAENLNHLFNFLDLQERLTRTNLIGIGIVCGLQASKSADNKTVTITKGTGVTSHGYLIVHGKENSEEAIDYKKYRTFDALKDKRYDVFVSGNTQKYALWELVKQEDELPADTALENDNFLDNKVCLLFYEMLDEKAKNCDPTSCDDKGVKVFINIRVLLISITDADTIIAELNQKANTSGSGEVFPGIFNLPEIKLPRFDVLATKLTTAADVYEAYQKVFSKSFVDNTGNALKEAFSIFKTYLKIQNNPFQNFNADFAFLHDGTINGNRLLHFQYYYDFFCDVLLAYNEWRNTARTLVAMCTPPEALFPRHLFLGTFTGMSPIIKSKYRNYFIPSPILSKYEGEYKAFKLMFQRLASMVAQVSMPFPAASITKLIDANIRITPSLLGNFPLGQRSIPYYYKPLTGNPKLLEVWDPVRTAQGKENQILHYNPSYNTTDDFVKHPLAYDLEPYNFLRIEGHIGKKIESAVATVQELRDKNRLPFDIVALTVDTLTDTIDPAKFECHFNDLDTLYDTLRAEFMCRLCKALACLYKIPRLLGSTPDPEDKLKKSTLELIKVCKDVIYYRESSIGSIYERLHTTILRSKESGLEVMEMLKKESLVRFMREANPAEAAATDNNDASDAVLHLVQIIHMVVSLSNAIPDQLGKYDHAKASDTIKRIAKLLGDGRNGTNGVLREYFSTYQCLKDLLELCDLAPFLTLHKEYLVRVAKLKLMQSLAEFSKHHPGITHKGGVPMGGTFILVYRDLETDKPVDTTGLADEFIVGHAVEVMPSTLKAAVATEPSGIVVEGIKASAAIQPKATAIKAKYSVKEKAMLTKKIEALKAKSLSVIEIEEILNIKIADVIKVDSIFDKVIADFANGTVIADFYLPYLCCSDCPPIHFTIQIPPPKVEFGLADPEYCNDDVGEYIFETNPTGGKIETTHKDAVIDKGNNIFAFMPSKVTIPAGQKDITASFTYLVEDQSKTISVKVYRKPDPAIEFKIDENNPLRVTFNLKEPNMVTSASWKFGDGTTSNDITPPPHSYAKGGEYLVSAEVKNGVCSAKAKDVSVVVNNPEAVKIDLQSTQACEDLKEVPVSITPPGGKLTGEPGTFNESPSGSGKYTIILSQIDLKGLPQRTLTYNYTSLQNQSGTFSITVFAKPSGKAAYESYSDLRLQVFLYELKNASQAIIDFGDGTKETYTVAGMSNFSTPLHLYAKAGEYIIRIELRNGTCSTLLELSVLVRGEVPPRLGVSFTGPVNNLNRVSTMLSDSPAFLESYQPVMDEVETFRKDISKAMDPAGNVDLKFFRLQPVKEAWISKLPVSPEAAREPSLQLLNIYAGILTAIATGQEGDLDENTKSLFQSILARLKAFKKLNEREKEIALTLSKAVAAEKEKIAKNNESSVKKEYVSTLTKIITALKPLTA